MTAHSMWRSAALALARHLRVPRDIASPSALRLDAEQRQPVLDIDRETLEKAPAFDHARWPLISLA